VKRQHFETLRPVCPVCASKAAGQFFLRLARVEREEKDDILEGVLHCSNRECLREYPIIDGIPLLVANLRQYVSDNLPGIYARRDLSEFLESLVGDCCGSNSPFDQTRQHLSSYAWDHYADLDPKEPKGEPLPGAIGRLLKTGLKLAGPFPEGPVLDAGCSVGRGSFSLAESQPNLVLGVDLHFPMLRMASDVLRRGTARYSRRRVGIVYDRREFPTRFANPERVDFWACDATAMPFSGGTFALAVSMNLLDCVTAPRELLVSLARVLRPGGKAVLGCPYDWSPGATPIETWMGGHSQRSPTGGASEAVLRALLTPGGHASAVQGLKLTGELDEVSWHVRLHDRSTMTYKVHLVVATAERKAGT
jgi:SAM-dependent methyltransferase/uncharacterized protein YbaR (Trm112 family)